MPRKTKLSPASTVAENQEETAGLKLSDFLCFAVYSANLAFNRAYKPALDALGLTYTQFIALVALSETNDVTIKALGEKLFLESNTLTPVLKKLERDGFIRRHRDSADERQVRVSLLPAGRKILAMEPGAGIAEATGLGTGFKSAQATVAGIRDSLLRAAQAKTNEIDPKEASSTSV